MPKTRKIAAAILAADVVGFSRMTSADEDRTLSQLRALRADVIDPIIASQNGRVFKRTGDGALVKFRSVVEAVRAAISLQSIPSSATHPSGTIPGKLDYSASKTSDSRCRKNAVSMPVLSNRAEASELSPAFTAQQKSPFASSGTAKLNAAPDARLAGRRNEQVCESRGICLAARFSDPAERALSFKGNNDGKTSCSKGQL